MQAWLAGLAGLTALTTLEMSGCNVTSLEGCACRNAQLSARGERLTPAGCSFPALPALTKLVMSDNQAFAGAGLAVLAQQAPRLTHLDLSNSKLAAVADLAPLASLPLGSLDLCDTPAAKDKAYREAAFKLFPGLEALDGADAEGEEVEESDGEDEDEACGCGDVTLTAADARLRRRSRAPRGCWAASLMRRMMNLRGTRAAKRRRCGRGSGWVALRAEACCSQEDEGEEGEEEAEAEPPAKVARA